MLPSHSLDQKPEPAHTRFSTAPNWPAYWLLLCLILFLLACSRASMPGIQPPTATPVVIRFEIQEAAWPVDDAAPTGAPLELLLIPVTTNPAPAPIPTATPRPTNTFQPTPTDIAQPTPTKTPDPELTAAPGPTSTPQPTEAPNFSIYTGEITDQIILFGPAPGFTLPVDMDLLEFKWKWTGAEIRPCQLPEGFGFDIRVWPNPNPTANPQIPEALRQTIQPLGVVDAAEEQEKIAASCDPDYQTRRYTVTGLKQTPGVSQAGGSGHFFWDVAYVQFEPYYMPLMVSAPLDFFIPDSAPGVPTTPTASPTPAYQFTPEPKPAGIITLVEPQSKQVYPANISPVEFRWRWAGENQAGKCDLPDGYGFELRIWSKRPDFTPLGVMDVVANQNQIICDPMTGVHSYTVLDLKQVEGVKATYMGQYRWDGHFWWDVALVSLRPYLPPDSASLPHDFEIALNYYTGSLDPLGEKLKCGDFQSWPEAQAVFEAAGGPNEDPHSMDSDGNKIACDELRQ